MRLVEEDLEEVAGDVDDETSLAESWQKTKQWMEMPWLRENFSETTSNMKEKLSCEPLLSQNSPPLDFPYSK